MAWATSSAVTSRPMGCRASSAARSSSGSGAASRRRATHGVSAVPGATPLTRIPSAMWSAAIARVSAYSAPLLALYTARRGSPAHEAIEHVTTTAGAGEARRCGSAGRNRARNADDVDVENVMPFVVRVVLDRSLGADAGVGDHDVDPMLAGDDLGDRCAGPTPGLRHHTPNVTDRLLLRGRPVVADPSSSTRAPRAASACAVASPIPDEPPVMHATRPSKSASPSWTFIAAIRDRRGTGIGRRCRGASGHRIRAPSAPRSDHPSRSRAPRSARGGDRRTRSRARPPGR